MTVRLSECSESLKSKREAYDIFYVNFITLSSFTIHGASAFPSIPNIVKVFKRLSSKVGKISGGSTFGNGTQIFTFNFTFFSFIKIYNGGRN